MPLLRALLFLLGRSLLIPYMTGCSPRGTWNLLGLHVLSLSPSKNSIRLWS